MSEIESPYHLVVQPTISQSFTSLGNNDLTAAIANFIHSEGLAFWLVDKPSFRALINTAQKSLVHYKMPNKNAIATTLLDNTFKAFEDCNTATLMKEAPLYGICLF